MTESTGPRRLSVAGIGGVFLFSNKARELTEWYTRHLGIVFTQYEGTNTYGTEFYYRFDRDPSMRTSTVFSISQTDKPLSPGRHEFEVNYRVSISVPFSPSSRRMASQSKKSKSSITVALPG